jgi:hypothetical protein
MFATPKVKMIFNNIKGFRGCCKKVRKTGKNSPADDKKTRGFYYRIPELAKVTVKLDENLQDETQCLVNQLGVVTYLPANKWKVNFFQETGGIKEILVE